MIDEKAAELLSSLAFSTRRAGKSLLALRSALDKLHYIGAKPSLIVMDELETFPKWEIGGKQNPEKPEYMLKGKERLLLINNRRNTFPKSELLSGLIEKNQAEFAPVDKRDRPKNNNVEIW